MPIAVPPTLLDALPLYAVDALDRDEAVTVAATLVAHPGLGHEVARWRDAAVPLVEAVPRLAPGPGARVRLLAALDGARPGSEGLVAAVAELFDVPLDVAHTTLARADDRRGWLPVAPGIAVLPVAGGPRTTGTACTLLRAAQATRFPWHRHLGEEVSLVLSGGAVLSDGRVVRTGDVIVLDETVEHDFAVDGDEPCLFAVRSRGLVPTVRP